MRQTTPGILRTLFILYAATVTVAIAMAAAAHAADGAGSGVAAARPARIVNRAVSRRPLSGPAPSRGEFRRAVMTRAAETGVPAGCVRSLEVVATAYTPIGTPREGGRYTKTGRDGRSAHGVAVDPRVIPLGACLWIPGYGHAVADDIGGAIRGRRVDLRMQDAGNLDRWGRRTVRVYVLGPSQPTG